MKEDTKPTDTKPTVLIINGYPRSGKNTFCLFASKMFHCIEHSTIDTVKNLATIMGWDGIKNRYSRKMLSDFKDFYTEWFNGPFNEVINLISFQTKNNEKSPENKVDFIFLHIREPKEIDKIGKWCILSNIDCHTVFINRDRKGDTDKLTNHADRNVENNIYDVYINNNSTFEIFKTNVLHFLLTVKDGSFKKMINQQH